MKKYVRSVAYYVRSDWRQKNGGDVIQAKAYCDYLNEQGVRAELIDSTADLSKVSILHVFNFDRPWDVIPIVLRAKAIGLQIVLSTLVHPKRSLNRYQMERSFLAERALLRLGVSANCLERMKALVRALLTKNWSVLYTCLRYDLRTAQLMLWNSCSGFQFLSKAEIDEVSRQGYFIGKRLYSIIGNGVPKGVLRHELCATDLEKINNFKAFALVGGRIEPRKNQIEILRAICGSNIPVVFAGAPNLRHRQYFKEFLREIRKTQDAVYLGVKSQSEFLELLRRCRIHVCASLFEVSPLVDLEALAAGKCIVSTKESLATEGLEGGVFLCDPWDRISIAEAIRTAWNANSVLQRLDIPTWSESGMKVKEFYAEILE